MIEKIKSYLSYNIYKCITVLSLFLLIIFLAVPLKLFSRTINSFKIYNIAENSILDFNNRINILFRKIQANRNQMITLESLRDTLLPKLITGEIRVPV